MWGGRLSMFGARGLGSLCGAFSVLKRCPEDRGHGDHAEQFGEGLGEYGSAHELCFGVPAVRQALRVTALKVTAIRSGRLIILLRSHAATPARMA